jgi:hypothetical protein
MNEWPTDFPALLEKAIDWASDIEAQVLESGRELTPDESIDARLAGVKEPARIRLLLVDEMPMPQDAALLQANARVGLLSPSGAGLALGYAVMLRKGLERDRRLLVHEFVHVAQYERFGGLEGFLNAYLRQVAADGYPGAALEREAEQRANGILGAK